MFVQPLQLDVARVVSPKMKPLLGNATIVRMLRRTRQSTAVSDALKGTDLRFSLVKPETSRLLVV
ncbi:MAG: hypothetical protein KUG74_15430 [Rhodobacteraceae bacterium]|nr:hypothetical protein [Paracoccaceae bacterium]